MFFCFYIEIENFTYKLNYIFLRLVKYSPYAKIYFIMNFNKNSNMMFRKEILLNSWENEERWSNKKKNIYVFYSYLSLSFKIISI